MTKDVLKIVFNCIIYSRIHRMHLLSSSKSNKLMLGMIWYQESWQVLKKKVFLRSLLFSKCWETKCVRKLKQYNSNIHPFYLKIKYYSVWELFTSFSLKFYKIHDCSRDQDKGEGEHSSSSFSLLRMVKMQSADYIADDYFPSYFYISWIFCLQDR